MALHIGWIVFFALVALAMGVLGCVELERPPPARDCDASTCVGSPRDAGLEADADAEAEAAAFAAWDADACLALRLDAIEPAAVPRGAPGVLRLKGSGFTFARFFRVEVQVQLRIVPFTVLDDQTIAIDGPPLLELPEYPATVEIRIERFGCAPLTQTVVYE